AWYGAWLGADAVLRPTLRDGRLARKPWFVSPTTARRFERFSAVNGIPFTTGVKGIPLVAGDARPDVVLRLYAFFESPGRDRLKWCAPCTRWFVDRSKNRTKQWGTPACHTRAWGRAARRAAGQQSQQRPARGMRRPRHARKGVDR